MLLPQPCERIGRLEVRKSLRRLVAHCDGGAELDFRVALGRELGAKQRAGDRRTPEGHYRIVGKAQRSRFHLFIPIDYPSRADADRGLQAGVLSEFWYRRILSALQRGSPPPSDSPLGGGLGFHGEGARWRGDSEHLDWTEGCIALADRDIEFIASRVAVGTPVLVLP